MIPLLEQKRDELMSLCVRHRVRRLELFGSATRADFDPQQGDLDFLVEFGDLSPREHAVHYFGLLEALGDLFQRPIDLVMIAAVKNPYFLEEIAASRTVLYDAA